MSLNESSALALARRRLMTFTAREGRLADQKYES
jgi:hypothetical protein